MASSGSRRRSSFAARAPSSVPSGGIRTSMMARSGSSRSTASTSDGASASPGHDVVPGVLEQPGEPLAEEGGVLADHDAHGSAASTSVPWPRGLSTWSDPPSAATRSARPDRSPSSRAASSVVGHADQELPVATDHLEHDPGRLGVLDRVRDRLAGDVVGRGGDGVGQRAVVDVHVDGQRQAADQVRQRGGQTVVEAARPEAVRDQPQLGDRRAQLGDALVEQAVDVDGAVVEVPLRQPQLHAQRDQPLLGAVVQVPLEPPAFLVADLDEPGPARLGVAEREGHLRAQPDDLDQGAAPVGDLAQQLGGRRTRAAHEDARLLLVQQHGRPRRPAPAHPPRPGRPATPGPGSRPAGRDRAARRAARPGAAPGGPGRR